jgi:hypothetical protein
MRRLHVTLALTLAAAPAFAAAVIATPALRPPTGGGLRCHLANVSATKTVEFEWTMYDFNGNAVFGPSTSTLQPLRNVRNGSPVPSVQSSCVVRVLSGGKSNLRVSLYAENSSGDIVAAVGGN